MSADAFWNQNQNSVKIYIPYLTERDVDSTGYGHSHCHSPCGVEEENARRLDKREQGHPLKRDTSASYHFDSLRNLINRAVQKGKKTPRHGPPDHNVD